MFSPIANRRTTPPCPGDDRSLARGDVVQRHHPFDPAVVVDVGVGVDHGGHRFVGDVLTEEVQALACRLDTAHRVDDDQPVVALAVRFPMSLLRTW
jgi:hypothetical protein